MGKQSSLTIAVLALLAEQPLHPYGMQRLIKERAMDRVVNVRNRSGLHAAIDRLTRERLVIAREIRRDAHHPERTIYELTPSGRTTLTQWLSDTLTSPARDFPSFPAAVSFLHLVAPQTAEHCLRTRADEMERDVAALRAELEHALTAGIPRLHLLESEYLIATRTAELAWVRSVADDIATDRLQWKEL
jgi:DNA-binding PadR family transcriptional regulator